MNSWLLVWAPTSNHSSACSASTLGANGRKSSRCLTILVEDVAHVRPARVGEQRPVAQRARPELHAALKPGDDLAVGHHVRGVARRGLAAPGLRPAALTAARISRRLNAGPRYGVELPRPGRLFCLAQCTAKAAPIAVPASCGAEGMNTSEKSPDFRTRSLVTQLSATPPAKHSLSSGTLRLRRRTSASDRRVGGLLQRRRDIGMPRQNLRIRLPRRTQQGSLSCSSWPIESRSPPGPPHNSPCRPA